MAAGTDQRARVAVVLAPDEAPADARGLARDLAAPARRSVRAVPPGHGGTRLEDAWVFIARGSCIKKKVLIFLKLSVNFFHPIGL